MTTKIPVRQITSGTATSGQVPVADGLGGASWGDVQGSAGCSLYQTTGTVLTINTWVTVLFDSERYDDLGWHSTSTNTGRITVDFTGRVYLTGIVDYGISGNAIYAIRLLKNGAVLQSLAYSNPSSTSGNSENAKLPISFEEPCSPGDYFELQALTNNASPTTGTGAEKTIFQARRTK